MSWRDFSLLAWLLTAVSLFLFFVFVYASAAPYHPARLASPLYLVSGVGNPPLKSETLERLAPKTL